VALSDEWKKLRATKGKSKNSANEAQKIEDLSPLDGEEEV